MRNPKFLKATAVLAIMISVLIVPILTFAHPSGLPASNGPGDTYIYAPDGKGYLKINIDGKKLLHVEGTPYEMGYQHGYLLAEDVGIMTSEDYFLNLILDMLLGMDKDEIIAKIMELIGDCHVIEDLLDCAIIGLKDFLINLTWSMMQENFQYVPEAFLEEMQGVADGATDAGVATTQKNVLILNMGFDALLTLGYPIAMIVTLIPGLATLVAKIIENLHACNGFVVYGDATVDGRVLLGRDFMFSSYGFHETALLIEQVPDDGYSFVSVSYAGFVGATAAMNSKGLGIGCDMVPALDCTPGESGMGVLLTCRNVVQYAGELSEAVDMINTSKRGVSWLYVLGDGVGEEIGGAVMETSAHKCVVRYSDYEQPCWSPYPQIEHKDDIVTVTNHYLDPEMNFGAGSWALDDDSPWRYETMTNLILDNYGTIDVAKGCELIDFLHPPNYNYYGGDTSQPVSSSVSLFDLSNLDVYSLFNYYDDPWAFHSLD